MPSTTDTLMDGAKCIEYCIPGADMKLAVLISLFAQIAGVSANTDSLIAGATCIQQCIPGTDMKLAVLISLVSSITGGGSGGGGSTSVVSRGNGEPTAATPGFLYLQLDSVPAGIIWWKDANGNWN